MMIQVYCEPQALESLTNQNCVQLGQVLDGDTQITNDHMLYTLHMITENIPHTRTQTHIRAGTRTHTHTHTQSHTNTRTHACMHM